jgi:hypothetical protein
MKAYALLLAALLTVAIGATHSWLGERRLIGPLLDPATRGGMLEGSAFARQVLRFAWHLTTIAWWGFAALLVAYARTDGGAGSGPALAIIAAIFAVTGLIILATSRGRHLAWPVFLAMAALTAVPLVN